MAYKHVIRAKTKNLMTDEMFTSVGFTKQSDGSWYIHNTTALNQKVLWENTEGIAGPVVISLYGKSPQPNAAGIMQFLVTFTNGDIQYINGTGSSDVWAYSEPIVPNPTKTIAKIQWVNITGRPLYLRDVMFEWGSTPTPYTPYNYLQSNKRMIKVSDVCQLYAKNIWKEYTDLYGVSIKNNNDGSITLNGTATQTFFYTNRLDYEIKPNHKYLYFDYYPQTPSWDTYVGGCEGKVNHESEVKFAIYNLNNDGTIDSSSPNLPSNTLLNTFCMCYKGFTFNNIIVKPQLFDLTEMFGAGHEPATVAEFRQKFPDELYPYSPQCWLTSYKSAVVCKTKNLFDVNNAVPYDFNTDNYDSNLVWLKDGIYTTRMNNYNLGSGLRIKNGLSLPAGKYTLSVRLVDFYNADRFVLGMRCKNTEGKWVDWSYGFTASEHKSGDILTFANTLPENTDLRLYLSYQNDNGQYLTGYVSYKDIQLEKGSTATSYVPYQHL